MTETSNKKSNKKRTTKKKKVKTTFKQKVFYAMTFTGSLLFLLCGVSVFYPYTRTFLITKIAEKYLTRSSNITFYFDKAYVNLWDFSITFKNFYVKNLVPFPDEPVLQSEHIQTKASISSNFKINYDIYIDNLQLNLYYIPGKGTNIGSLLKILKKELYSNVGMTRSIRSISIEKVRIVITQNLEPQKIKINTPKHFYFNKQSENVSSDYTYILECI
ncbi:MAG: hypothetical protein ACP5QY_14370, partial [Candidatus Hydrogenedens sp.]